MAADPQLARDLADHGQGHLLRWWDDLDASGPRSPRGRDPRASTSTGWTTWSAAWSSPTSPRARPGPGPPRGREPPAPDRRRAGGPPPGGRAGRGRPGRRRGGRGRRGRGQGTRLGFDGPKGTYPIGPVSAATLFQIHCEKILALSRRHGKPIPFYVMTSPENHETTRRFFAEHAQLRPGPRPPLRPGADAGRRSRTRARSCSPGKDHLALSPDGHGGTLAALAAPGPGGEPSCLEEMKRRGIRTLFYFQVDNPLVQIADPAFLGLHRKAEAEVSFKVVEKVQPDEKVGVVVEVGGRPQVIEYSDLPAELAERREPEGNLELWAGSIAIHVFERAFIERIVAEARLPFHRAIKKVRYLDESGAIGRPARRPTR